MLYQLNKAKTYFKKIFKRSMEIDFISNLHKATKRDYLARVNDKDYPKIKLQL